MKGKEPMTLAQMAERSAVTNGRMTCPKCNCTAFASGGVQQGVAVTFRYRICRNCGAKFFTEQPPERILRPVESRVKSDPDEHDDGGSLV